jgi:hypothetical protein
MTRLAIMRRMSSLHSIVIALLASSTLACNMPNPAFEGGDELGDASDDGETAESESSTLESDSEVGESSAGTTSESTSETSSGCTPGEPCGECRACNDMGECEVTVGATCGAIDCVDYVFGEFGEKCVAFDHQLVDSTCSEEGACKPGLELCDIPGVPLCDLACTSACVPMELVGAGVCAPDGPTSECMGSECIDLATLVSYACLAGFCTPEQSVCGGGTFCAEGMCIDQG